jgi:hypothetical protein
MPVKSLSQSSFFSPEFADPTCVVPGTLVWLLGSHARWLFPQWLFGDWHGDGQIGRDAWPARVLMTALLLRTQEGIKSRRAMARRLKTDIAWRAAAGLEIGSGTPDEATFRRFEKFLRRRDRGSGVPRYLLAHEHIVRVCLDEGVVSKRASWAMDSTPMWCFGAVRGTVRLLGDGLRGLCLQWAKATKTDLAGVATDWDVPLLLAKSTKGHFRIDWKDRDARAEVIDDTARTVVRVVGLVRGHLDKARRNKRKRLLRRCRHLLQVIANDLETDDAGRLVVARRVAKDRLVSITDPQARHSRKTKSRPFHGYRLHVLGDAFSGLIASVSVTPANRGDSHPAPRLIQRAKRLCAEIEQVLADTAYGGAELHFRARSEQGVDVLAPPIPTTAKKGVIPATDFALNLSDGHATCPQGVRVEMRTGKRGDRYFRWPVKVCRDCPLRSACFGKTDCSRAVRLHEHHEELQAIRERWKQPEVRESYRERSQCERLINETVRRGGRQATAWGLQAAVLQAHTIAISCNLALLAKALAGRHEPALTRAA